MADSHELFQRALAKYYKAERDRTEACLGDIVDAMAADQEPSEIKNRIAARLIEHYTR